MSLGRWCWEGFACKLLLPVRCICWPGCSASLLQDVSILLLCLGLQWLDLSMRLLSVGWRPLLAVWVLGTPGLGDQCMLGICAPIPHMLHTLRCSMAAGFCIHALLSHCLVVLCCLVVLPLLLLVQGSVCLFPSSVCLLSYLLLLTVGARPVVPDRSRLCWDHCSATMLNLLLQRRSSVFSPVGL